MITDQPTYILGISCFYHDAAACLIKDGEIVAAAQEERFTRKKHDPSFPVQAVAYCLKEAGIKIEQVNFVAYYDKPWLKFERLLETYMAFAPRGLASFLAAMPSWIKDKLWMDRIIKNKLGFTGQCLFFEHHESHAASAFFPSPFQEAAILTIDGVGEWTTTSIGVGHDNQIDLISEMRFPHSLGMLYSAFTYYLGFKVNSGEYKVMGLAPYGEPKYTNLIYEYLADLKEDGSFKLDMSYFNYCTGLTMTSEKFHQLFGGQPRQPESALTQREMDLAASLQQFTEEVILRMAKYIKVTTQKRYLCLAGGVALNCVANGKILRQNIFEDIWIQPAAGDAGGALGAALLAWHHYLDQPRHINSPDSQQGSYLGPAYFDQEIGEFLDSNKIPYKKHDIAEIPKIAAGLINQNKVVGWFQGRMEFGPRALGSRSIIGDARSPEMQSIMNLKIKFRESFRPFAPSVLEEYAKDYFDIDRPSPYMLLVAQVKSNHHLPVDKSVHGLDRLKIVRSTIPAVTHIDYSARLHTVNRLTNPLYHQMIKEFFDLTGCPVIINTSFNVRGEPIVCSPQHAYTCFMRTNMDHLILQSYVLDKNDQPQNHTDNNWQNEFTLD